VQFERAADAAVGTGGCGNSVGFDHKHILSTVERLGVS